MEQQAFVHDLGEGKRTLDANGRPLPLFDVVAPHDPPGRPTKQRFHEDTLEPSGRIENPIFSGGCIESVLRPPASTRPEEHCTLPFAMNTHDDLAGGELLGWRDLSGVVDMPFVLRQFALFRVSDVFSHFSVLVGPKRARLAIMGPFDPVALLIGSDDNRE